MYPISQNCDQTSNRTSYCSEKTRQDGRREFVPSVEEELLERIGSRVHAIIIRESRSISLGTYRSRCGLRAAARTCGATCLICSRSAWMTKDRDGTGRWSSFTPWYLTRSGYN